MKKNNQIIQLNNFTNITIPIILIFIMVYAEHYVSYLAFHSFAEYFSIFVAFSIAFTTYYTYNLTKNNYLLFLGLGYFWVGALDILHTQTYPGMNIYDNIGINTTLTFWIFTRFLEAMIFIFAILLKDKKFSIKKVLTIFSSFFIFVLILAIYFPLELFSEENGLSNLKIYFEYLIVFILLIALILNKNQKSTFNKHIYKAIQMAIIFTIISEACFTLYTDLYGFTNLLGHIFKFLSFWVLLVSLIKISLIEPQKKLDEQNTLLNSVLNATPNLIFYKNYLYSDGEYIGCNEAFEKYVGKSNKEIIGKTDIELFGKEVGSFFRIKDKEMLDKDATVINEDWATYPNGNKVLLSTFKTPFKDKANNILGVLGISRDITKEHEKTQELKNLKERMELALLGNNDGLWDWNMITNEVYFSPRWKEMLGYSDEELPNEFSTWENRIHPDDLKATMHTINKNLDGQSDYMENTHRLKHKDGSWIWILDRGKTTFDQDGKALRMIGTNTDITREKALELKYAKQAQIIENIHDSVIATNLKGIIISYNHGSEVLLGYKADKMIGQHISMIYLEEDYESLSKNIDIVKNYGEQNFEIRLVKKSGEVIDADLSLSLLKDEKGATIGIIGYSQDITIRKKAENELKEQHTYLESIINGINEPIMVIKEDYTVELMNNILKDNLKNLHMADPKHPKCYEVLHNRSTPCSGLHYPCPLQDVIISKKHTTVIHRHHTKDGNNQYTELLASPLFDKDKKCIGIIQSSRDITGHLKIQSELINQKNILDHQAHHDALTGLPNRILFNDRLKQAIEKAKRNKSEFALLFIDLDRFKEINDSLGHTAGDEVLITVTSRLIETIREEDTVARLGGDEFTVILEDLNQVQDASLIANKILKNLSQPININNHVLYVSSSIGISIYPEDGESAQNLLKYADSAMYKAKDEGRNNYQYYNSTMTELTLERLIMEASLRDALKNEELLIYYQPQVNGVTNTLIGMEALIRWKHPTMGIISPEKFIPLAESTGLIIDIDRYVMKTAMTQISKWYKDGFNPGILAMNLAVRQLQKEDFMDVLQNLIQETDCKTKWLALELTEGQIMTNPDKAIKTLTKISDLGIELAVDDFGTGYSSLAYLKRLPINKLKIDQAFVKDLPKDEEDAGIIKAIIALAKSLNLKIIADGVETKEQVDFMLEHGCENIQGYYYSKPVPSHEMLEILKGHEIIKVSS